MDHSSSLTYITKITPSNPQLSLTIYGIGRACPDTENIIRELCSESKQHLQGFSIWKIQCIILYLEKVNRHLVAVS